jgi:broad specificity phosphatase PhoE
MAHGSATLLFVRHAAASGSREGRPFLCGAYDAPLSEEGRCQVDLLRRRLSAEGPFDALYVSPLLRALHTAAAAPAALRRSARILKSLAEIDCGIADGLPIEEVRRQYPDVWRRNQAQTDENFAWPQGESYRRFRKRVLRAVDAIAGLHAGQRVLIVTHAGVINQVLGSIAGQSAARWESPRPRNTSVTSVLWGKHIRSVTRYDDCSHLDVEALV